jgi:hypothetical protein
MPTHMQVVPGEDEKVPRIRGIDPKKIKVI